VHAHDASVECVNHLKEIACDYSETDQMKTSKELCSDMISCRSALVRSQIANHDNCSSSSSSIKQDDNQRKIDFHSNFRGRREKESARFFALFYC
jgi:hypothetical protein